MNEFIDIKGFEGIYTINIHGVIKSLDRMVKGNGADGFQKLNGKIIKHGMNVTGYPAIMLWKDSKPKRMTIHRLVALHFIPNPENKPEINHKDGDKTNYSVNNIEWCTAKENRRHAVDTGLLVNPSGEKAYGYGIRGPKHNAYGKTGELCRNSKLIINLSTGIYYYGTGEASEATGYNRGTLRAMLSGRDRNHTSLIYV